MRRPNRIKSKRVKHRRRRAHRMRLAGTLKRCQAKIRGILDIKRIEDRRAFNGVVVTHEWVQSVATSSPWRYDEIRNWLEHAGVTVEAPR